MRSTREIPPRGWPILLAIWLPLSVALAGAIAQLTGATPLMGLLGGLVTGLVSFALGLVVWWFTGVVPWTSLSGPRFFFLHLGVALLYSFAWWMAATVTFALLTGNPPAHALGRWWTSDVVGWDVMVGLAVYGLAAGISYAIRLQANLQAERLAVARAEAAARAAQHASLVAQVNPHFLFNTLHSVASLVRDDPARAEDAIDSLGTLLRASLHHDGGPTHTLADEWQFCEEFLALERLRLGDRLRVETVFTSSALTWTIPRLTLQPILENAIRHAIVTREEGGTISVTGDVTRDRLRITLSDDGPGSAEPPDGESRGVGLRSIAARLAALSPPGELTVRTAPGEGFRVTLLVPQILL